MCSIIISSASNGRLSWGEQAYNILSQYQASYPAILDIATSLSLNKLLGGWAQRGWLAWLGKKPTLADRPRPCDASRPAPCRQAPSSQAQRHTRPQTAGVLRPMPPRGPRP